MTVKKTEIENIKEDLEKSGFPTELVVSSILLKHEWTVNNQVYYIDEEENKARTVDVVAHKAFFGTMGNHDRLNFSLVIECKKSEKPWVFYSVPQESDIADIHSFAALKVFSLPDISIQPAYRKWAWGFHYAKFKNLAVNSYEPFRGDGSQIATATHQVTKATTFNLEESPKSLREMKFRPVFVYLPIIVFDGNLYDCQPKAGNFEINKQSSFLYSLVTTKQIFLIDILELAFLDSWLDIVDSEVLSLKEAIENVSKT